MEDQFISLASVWVQIYDMIGTRRPIGKGW